MYRLVVDMPSQVTKIKQAIGLPMELIYRAYDSAYLSAPVTYSEAQKLRDAAIRKDSTLVCIRVELASHWQTRY